MVFSIFSLFILWSPKNWAPSSFSSAWLGNPSLNDFCSPSRMGSCEIIVGSGGGSGGKRLLSRDTFSDDVFFQIALILCALLAVDGEI